MNKQLSDNNADQSPEVRLELSRAGIDQVMSLYESRRDDRRNEVSFEDVLGALRYRRSWLIAGVVTGALLAWLIAAMSTPLYAVSARVLIERTEPDGTPRPAGSAFVATQAQLMRSTAVVERALGNFSPSSAATLQDLQGEALVLEAMDWLQSSPISGTEVIALSYLGPDGSDGAQLLEQIVLAYRSSLQDTRRRELEKLATSSEAEIDVLLSERAALETRITDLRAENSIIGSAADAARAQNDLLAEQVAQLTAVRNQRITLENRLAAGGEQLAILDPATRKLQEALWQAEAELGRLQLDLTPEHPSVVAAARSVEVLRRQLNSSGSATPQALRRDIAATTGLETELIRIEAQQRARLREIETHRREEDVLLAELARLEELVAARRQTLLDQELQSKLSVSGTGVDARMITSPVIPENPVWPRPKLLLVVGVGLGFSLALLLGTLSVRRRNASWEAAS